MNKQILIKAIEHFGKDVQIDKIQEEAMELALILHQFKCPTKDKDKMLPQVYSELADMKIMMQQAEILFDKDRIDAIVELKLARLEANYFPLWNVLISQPIGTKSSTAIFSAQYAAGTPPYTM